MKNYSCFILCCCTFFVGVQILKAQEPSAIPNPWIVGFGFNSIYDSGEGLNGVFDLKNNYNFDTPLRFSVEKRFREDYGLELSFNFNRFLKGKRVNNVVLEDDISLLAIDAMYKYYFTNLFLDTHRASFEGFATTGLGTNFYNKEVGITANIGFGLNYFITEKFWLTGQVLPKFLFINRKLGNNYVQYSFGFIIRV